MSQPVRHDWQFNGTESNAGGSAVETKAHSTIGLFVDGDNVTSLDMTLQGSVEGSTWSSLNRAPNDTDVFQVTETELNSDGAVYFVSHSFAIELIRPYINSVDADGLDVYVFLSGQSGRGVQFGRDLDL